MPESFLGLCPTQWQAIGSIGTFVAVFIALTISIFQDKLRNWFHKPNLKVSIKMESPWCHKAIIGNRETTAECYYFRIKVENIGTRKADSVEVIAKELLKKDNTGNYSVYTRFIPLNLVWSHDLKAHYNSISPNMFKYCDIGHITDPAMRNNFSGEYFNINTAELFLNHSIEEETIFCFDTKVKPFTSTHLIPSGEYRLVILLGAENIKSVKKQIDISFNGNWTRNEMNMLSENVQIIVSS